VRLNPALAIALCLPPLAHAIDLPAVADATLRTAQPASNFGALPQLQVDNSTYALIRFDLSALPTGLTYASIAQATMRLYVNRVTSPGFINFSLVESPWTETSATAANMPTLGAGLPIPLAINDVNTYYVVDVTQLVRDWVSTPSIAHGLLLTAPSPTAVFFDSKENTATSHAAAISVVLNGPAGPPCPQGPRGLTDPAGPSSLINMLTRLRHDVSLPGRQLASFSLACPTSHPYTVSGGCGHRDFNSAAMDIEVAYTGPDPSIPAYWRCMAENTSDAPRAAVWRVVCSH